MAVLESITGIINSPSYLMRTRMNQFCLGKTLGEMRWRKEDDCKCRESKNNLAPIKWVERLDYHRQNMTDRLPISGRKYKMLVEKCKPLGKTVLIEILKLKNARMKVIIVSAASAERLVLSWWLAPCLDRLQMKTINPCRSPVIMCYFLNTLPPPVSGGPASARLGRILFQFKLNI